MDMEQIAYQIIGSAIEVHRNLGPGLLESSYERCLQWELHKMGFTVQRQLELPIQYKTIQIESGYRIDLLVENSIIIELKSIEKILPIHEAQVLTYLKLSGKSLGLLLNFNVKMMKQGVKRLII